MNELASGRVIAMFEVYIQHIMAVFGAHRNLQAARVYGRAIAGENKTCACIVVAF